MKIEGGESSIYISEISQSRFLIQAVASNVRFSVYPIGLPVIVYRNAWPSLAIASPLSVAPAGRSPPSRISRDEWDIRYIVNRTLKILLTSQKVTFSMIYNIKLKSSNE